jgi:hypothetical protein
MRYLNVGIKLESTPVIKIWDDDQLQKSEIILTWLAGSMFEMGGFNGTAAGGSQGITPGENEARFWDAKIQIFSTHPWAVESCQRTKRYVEQIEKVAETLQGIT